MAYGGEFLSFAGIGSLPVATVRFFCAKHGGSRQWFVTAHAMAQSWMIIGEESRGVLKIRKMSQREKIESCR